LGFFSSPVITLRLAITLSYEPHEHTGPQGRATDRSASLHKLSPVQRLRQYTKNREKRPE
jgi:hypothetical protein